MNDSARTSLVQVIGKHGRGLCDDVRRTEALLRDVCGQHRKEVSVLVGALRERVPADLLGSHSGTPVPMVISRLATRLEDQLGFAPDAARWAVESWALALGVVSTADINRSRKASTVPHASTSAAQPQSAAAVSAEAATRPAVATPQAPGNAGAGSSNKGRWIVLGIVALIVWLVYSNSQDNDAVSRGSAPVSAPASRTDSDGATVVGPVSR